MKIIHSLIVILVLVSISSATIRRVGPGVGVYNTISDAISAASANDSVIIEPSPWTYAWGAIPVSVPLHFIGSGWPTTTYSGTVISVSTPITITRSASGSSLEGLFVNLPTFGDPATPNPGLLLEENTSDIILDKLMFQCSGYACHYDPWCQVCPTYYYYCWGVQLAGNNSGVVIRQCLFYPTVTGGWCVVAQLNFPVSITASGCSCLISNCLFKDLNEIITGGGNSTIEFQNNVVYSCGCTFAFTWTVGISNTIFWSSSPSYGGTGAMFNAGSGTTVGSNWTLLTESPFVDAPTDFHLTPGSPCQNAGVPNQTDEDGSRIDMGIYGGQVAFVDCGASNYPFVTDLSVPTTVPQNGLLPIYSSARTGCADAVGNLLFSPPSLVDSTTATTRDIRNSKVTTGEDSSPSNPSKSLRKPGK